MLVESNIRARYLSLALDARKIIDELVSYVKEADVPLRKDELRRVVESLTSANDRERLFSVEDRTSLFGDYERMQTLEEVKNTFPNQDVANQLQNLLQENLDPAARKRSAEQAIQFFCALEGRALQRYTQTMDM